MWLVIKDIILLQQNMMEQLSILEKQKKMSLKYFLNKGKVKVIILKIRLIINMLYVVDIQFNFSNSIKKLSAIK